MKTISALCFVLLAGCVSEPGTAPTTPEGCPVSYGGEMMQAYTRACIAAYNEEKARLTGGTVTKCFPGGDGTVTCVSN